MKTPEIIEAVPQSQHNEYKNRMRLVWITIGCMGANTGAFFAGITTPQAGELLFLWMDSLAFGMGSAYLNLLRKQNLLDRMEAAQATYTIVEPSNSVKQKGRNRLLRLMPPGLKAGIPAKWF